MAPLTHHTWSQGYAYHPFDVKPTPISFAYSRHPSANSTNTIRTNKSCNISTIWTANNLRETLINGVLQGRKQSDPKGASALSKTKIWELFQEIDRIVGGEINVPVDMQYERVKGIDALAVRRRVKEDAKSLALKGWDG